MTAAAMSHIVVLTLVLKFGIQASTVKWRLVTLPALPNLHRGSDGFVPTVALIPSFDTIATWVKNQRTNAKGGEIGEDVWDGAKWNATVQIIFDALGKGGDGDSEELSEVLEEVEDSPENDSEDGEGTPEEEEGVEGDFDLSPLVQLCDLVPPTCTSCNLSLIICSICCPSLFPSMPALPPNMTAHLETWLSASLWWSGLEPVLQRPEISKTISQVPQSVPREGLWDQGWDQGLLSLVNNFHIVQSKQPAAADEHLDLEGSPKVSQICGYHTLGDRQGHIVGGYFSFEH